MIFVTFITNEFLDNRITASQVFVVVTLIEALRFSSTLYFPMAVEKVSEAVVSIRRIKVWGQIIVFSCWWIFCKMPPFIWYHCVLVGRYLALSVPKLAVFPECCRYSPFFLGRVCYRYRETGSHVGAVVYVSSIAQGSSVVVPAEWLKCLKAGEASECTSCADSRDQAVAVQSWGTGVLSGPGGEELAESSLLLGQEEWPQIHLILCVQNWVLSSTDVLLVDIWATFCVCLFIPGPSLFTA